MSDDSPTVVEFRTGAPSAKIKDHALDDPRPRCKHRRIEIWRKEPIIECVDCGAVVDAHYWIRERVGDWKQAQDAVDWRVAEAKRELVELQTKIRWLRGEFNDEAEKRRVSNTLMIMPPQKSFR